MGRKRKNIRCQSARLFIAILCIICISFSGCKGKDVKETESKPTDTAIQDKSPDNNNDSDKKDENIGDKAESDKNMEPETEKNPEYLLAIDAAKTKIPISDMLYGLFFEDINYAADGGLYAEMVINRSFEFDSSKASNGALHGYTVSGDSNLEIKNKQPLNQNNTSYVQITNQSDNPAGLSNRGFLDGMAVKGGASYQFSAYLKSSNYTSKISVSLQDLEGNTVAEGKIEAITDTWTKYSLELNCSSDVNPAKLVLLLDNKGVIDADMISLFPFDTYKNRENGLRADLVQMLADLKPSFLRFPGGCIVEGNPLSNAYNWKDSVGDVAERKINTNLWIGNTNYPYYQTYGLGFYEYFLLCEDLGAEPIPIVNCGMSCQARGNGRALKEDLQTYIQDALDLIEFANGDINTTWGAIRAEMGHPEPFHMKYLGVGNEQWGTEYFKQYDQFQTALREHYPEIKLITSSGPASGGDLYEYAWSRIKGHSNDTLLYADLVDEHYYNTPDWFLQNVTRYDKYDRNGTSVFLGEYAAKANNLYAAVAEAAYMTGLERNSDIVKMAAYAPLFGSVVSSQWTPDLIWFTNNTVFGSVNYYVQKLFSNNKGDYTVQSELTGESLESKIQGKIGVGTWKTSAVFDDIKVIDHNTGEILYQDEFEESALGWNTSSQGNWKIIQEDSKSNNKVYIQENKEYPTNNSIMGSASYAGKTTWSNYTYTVRAKKLSGAEGFLIPFAVKDSDNFYHWNIGGWNNTLSVIEQAQGGSKTNITDTVPLNIHANEWYDIRIEVYNDKVDCFLNDSLIHTFWVETSLPVYHIVSIDETTGDLIIKLVNSSNLTADIQIDLQNFEIDGNALVEVLTSERREAVNAAANPYHVVPVSSAVNIENQFVYQAAPYSVNILRLTARK